jgi:hypothetical protein
LIFNGKFSSANFLDQCMWISTHFSESSDHLFSLIKLLVILLICRAIDSLCFPRSSASSSSIDGGVREHRERRTGGLKGGEGSRSGTRKKIVTQPHEEVGDLGRAGSGASETKQRGEAALAGEVAVLWQCDLPNRDVTQVAGIEHTSAVACFAHFFSSIGYE